MRLDPPWTRPQRLEVKREAETDYSRGKNPEQRSVEELLGLGVVNLDKPRGPTSHEVAYMVKKMLGLAQAGHGGTLESFGEIPLSRVFFR
ncbi:MAG: hypothetical protein QXX19_04370 [Candidatus Caldarchaeum sp.]